MTPATFHLVVNGQRRAQHPCEARTYTVRSAGDHMTLYQPFPGRERHFNTPDACKHAMTQIAPLSEWEVVT